MAAVDPCAVLDKMPRAQVRSRRPTGPVGSTSGVLPRQQGLLTGGIPKNLGLTLVAVKDKGAAEFLETANAEVTEFDAQGYPLYLLQNEEIVGLCLGLLDVHDGQFVWITYGMASTTDRPEIPSAKFCKTVPVIAASTVTALG